MSTRDKNSSVSSSSSSVEVRPLAARVHARQEAWQRLYNLVAHLAHPKGDHRTNEEEDEAHDLIRELRTETSDVAARVHALIAQWREEAELETVDRHPGWVAAESALRACADALEAALAAALAPQPEQDEYASEAEYQNHLPWCKARHLGRLVREHCNCDAPAAALAPNAAQESDMAKTPVDLVEVELTLSVIKGCTNPPLCARCDRAAKRLLGQLAAALAPQEKPYQALCQCGHPASQHPGGPPHKLSFSGVCMTCECSQFAAALALNPEDKE